MTHQLDNPTKQEPSEAEIFDPSLFNRLDIKPSDYTSLSRSQQEGRPSASENAALGLSNMTITNEGEQPRSTPGIDSGRAGADRSAHEGEHQKLPSEKAAEAQLKDALAAFKAGNIEKLMEIAKGLDGKGGPDEDDNAAAFHLGKMLSKETGMNVALTTKGVRITATTQGGDANARDQASTYQSVQYDKNGKAISAEERKLLGFTGGQEVTPLSPEQAGRAMRLRMEALKYKQ